MATASPGGFFEGPRHTLRHHYAISWVVYHQAPKHRLPAASVWKRYEWIMGNARFMSSSWLFGSLSTRKTARRKAKNP